MLRSKPQRWIPELRFGHPPLTRAEKFSRSFWEKLGIFLESLGRPQPQRQLCIKTRPLKESSLQPRCLDSCSQRSASKMGCRQRQHLKLQNAYGWEVLNGVGVDGVGVIFLFFYIFRFLRIFLLFCVFLRFSLLLLRTRANNSKTYCKKGEFHSDPPKFYLTLTSAQPAISNHGLETMVYIPLVNAPSLHGLLSRGFSRGKTVGQRPIKEGKRPIKVNGLFSGTLACWKTAPLKRPIKRSMIILGGETFLEKCQ